MSLESSWGTIDLSFGKVSDRPLCILSGGWQDFRFRYLKRLIIARAAKVVFVNAVDDPLFLG